MKQRASTAKKTSGLHQWIFFFVGFPISIGTTLVFGQNYATLGLILSFGMSLGFLAWKKKLTRRVCASGGNVIFFGILNFVERSIVEALPNESFLG